MSKLKVVNPKGKIYGNVVSLLADAGISLQVDERAYRPTVSDPEIVKILPCMRALTAAPLYGEQGYAIKVAVKKAEATKLIPVLKKLGATDILEYEIRRVVV